MIWINQQLDGWSSDLDNFQKSTNIVCKSIKLNVNVILYHETKKNTT